MDEQIDQVEIQQEIDGAIASLRQLHRLFDGREMPIAVARIERAVRAQLEAAQSLLSQ